MQKKPISWKKMVKTQFHRYVGMLDRLRIMTLTMWRCMDMSKVVGAPTILVEYSTVNREKKKV